LPIRILAIIFTVSALQFSGCSKKEISNYPITSVPFNKVQFTDNFWAPRIETNRRITIPHAFRKCEETGIIDNFSIAAGFIEGEQSGVYPFDDTDVFKTIEGAAYSLATHPDPKLEKFVDSLIVLIAGAQEPDGYLYTARTNRAQRMIPRMGETRWSNLGSSHELYNAGHLYEAAIAYYRATGKKSLLDVAIRNAGLITETFGPNNLRTPPGHQEIELGLVKLYDVTAKKKYLELAKFFLEERGQSHNGRELWGEYAQDHQTVFKQEEAAGHAVRFAYMCSAMMDVGVRLSDSRFISAVHRLWRNVLQKKLYVTGGIGSVGFIEGFGENYDLPNMSAYQETCSSIAYIMWNYRMFLQSGDAKYIDLLERTLYNSFLAGVSLDGSHFFYDNPLASKGQHQRSDWFVCSCCITNVARFMPQIPGYVYAIKNDQLFINLFVNSSAEIVMENITLSVQQEKDYPWNGQVRIFINPSQSAQFSVSIRIPVWSINNPIPGELYQFKNDIDEKPSIRVNDVSYEFEIGNGYAIINRNWQKGDVIELSFPMSVRYLVANSLLDENKDKIALQRGPMVYCLEGVDNRNGNVLNLAIRNNLPITYEFRDELLNGVVVIKGNAFGTEFDKNLRSIRKWKQSFTAIPHYAWAHRGRNEMAVWMPTSTENTMPLNSPSFASQGKVSSAGGKYISALNDCKYPANSGNEQMNFFRWSNKYDTLWVQYNFNAEEEVSMTEIYWVSKENENIDVPDSWRVLALYHNQWRQVWNPTRIWPTEKNKLNKVIFETARTKAIRLEIIPQKGKLTGIYEWQIK